MSLFPYPDLDVFPSIPIPAFDRPHQCCLDHDLKEFPNRIGFGEVAGQSISHIISTEDRAYLMQAWLFYAFVEKAAGLCVKDTKLFSIRLINQTLGTEIHDLWIKRVQYLQQLPELDRNEAFAQLRGMTFLVNDQFWKFDKMEAGPRSNMAHVALSIRFLLQTLHYFSKHEYSVPADVCPPEPISRALASSTHSLSKSVIYDQMRKKAWCPFQIKDIITRVDFLEMYFLASLQRSPRSQSDHANCDFDQCVALHFTRQTFIPSHRTHFCSCSFIGPDLRKVTSMLQAGEIPLVRLREGDETLDLEIVEAKWNSPYVAISHVWSDRQFGSYENKIPQCWVAYLDKCISNVPITENRFERIKDRNRLFWLDTFCIPVDPENPKLRTQAMGMIDFIFSQARAVLAFDSELQKYSFWDDSASQARSTRHRNGLRHISENDDMESQLRPAENDNVTWLAQNAHALRLIGHVYACRWMQRAWTYQESVLSRECYLQFKDQAISLNRFSPGLTIRPYQVTITRMDIFCGYVNKHNPPCSSVVFREYYCLLVHPYVLYRLLCPPIARKVDKQSFPWSMMLQLYGSFVYKLPRNYQDLSSQRLERTRRAKERRNARVWNDLQSRYTTKTGDLMSILTNLMGYFPHPEVNPRSQREALESLITSLEDVPMDFLFRRNLRNDLETRSSPCWYPITLKGRIEPGFTMRKSSEGYVLDLTNHDFRIYLLPSETAHLQRFSIQPKPNVSHILCIQCLCPSQDRTSTEDSQPVCIILRRNGHQAGPIVEVGARMRISQEKNRTVFLQYDGSLRAVSLSDAEQAGSETLEALASECRTEGSDASTSLTCYPLQDCQHVEYKRKYILREGMLFGMYPRLRKVI